MPLYRIGEFSKYNTPTTLWVNTDHIAALFFQDDVIGGVPTRRWYYQTVDFADRREITETQFNAIKEIIGVVNES